VKQTAIFAPFIAMMILTAIVWVYMYAKRIPFIVRNRFTDDQLAPDEFARLSPPDVSSPSDNLKNLFEMPTLFYAMSLYLFSVGAVDLVHVVSAWLFVTFRVLHSLVHCTFNLVILRFWLYCIASIALFVMIARAAFAIASA